MKIETIHQSDRDLLWKVKRQAVLVLREECSSGETASRVYVTL